jgi:hypothetical protein
MCRTPTGKGTIGAAREIFPFRQLTIITSGSDSPDFVAFVKSPLWRLDSLPKSPDF